MICKLVVSWCSSRAERHPPSVGKAVSCLAGSRSSSLTRLPPSSPESPPPSFVPLDTHPHPVSQSRGPSGAQIRMVSMTLKSLISSCVIKSELCVFPMDWSAWMAVPASALPPFTSWNTPSFESHFEYEVPPTLVLNTHISFSSSEAFKDSLWGEAS